MVSNNGTVSLKTECLTLYINGVLKNFNVVILNDTFNFGLWDPGEIINISFTSVSLPYRVKVCTCESVCVEKEIT